MHKPIYDGLDVFQVFGRQPPQLVCHLPQRLGIAGIQVKELARRNVQIFANVENTVIEERDLPFSMLPAA